MSENEEWVTVEEQLVHIETSGLLLKSNDQQRNSDVIGTKEIHLVGLDTTEPILQIGRQIFAGTYVDAAETSVFFRCRDTAEADHSNAAVDSAFPREIPRLTAQLECKTNKKLRFKRIFLKAKAKS